MSVNLDSLQPIAINVKLLAIVDVKYKMREQDAQFLEIENVSQVIVGMQSLIMNNL